MSKPVFVKDVKDYFGYRMIVGNEESLKRPIYEGNVNRPGLELSGYFEEPSHRIVVIGEKESHYIDKMSREQQEQVFDFLTADNVPMILISRDLPCPEVLYNIAYRKNFPVFSSFASTSSLIVELLNYLEEFFAHVDSLHGVLLEVYGHGVLITGESAIGKSEIALELIRRGHVLVADDRVDVFRAHNTIFGEAPAILKNMLELRGVGIVDIQTTFGYMSTDDRTNIECVIHLQKQDDDDEYDRLGLDNQMVETIFGVDIPKIILPVREGRSIAVMIEAAVTHVIMKTEGVDTSKVFHDRLLSYIKEQEENN
ncbi:MAG: HPr(Ser) kinase/phosphatase [Erysipelotrichaceae bacterium]|nr:HPr(Ser) kinase/phosphatase [Erysipelotrichaceae bacterium]